jgi:hypothetical protein
MSTGSRFIENTVSATVFHGSSRGVSLLCFILGVFVKKLITIMKTLPKTIFVLVSESSLFLMAPDIVIMVLMGTVRRGVQCSAIKDRERRSSVYIPFNQTVVDRGKMSSRFKINEYVPNKASLASMNRAQGCGYHRRTVALTWKHMPSYKTSRTSHYHFFP